MFRMPGLHLIQETVAAINAGTAGLVMHDDPDLAGIADRPGHLVGGKCRGGHVVGGAGGQRNVAVDTRVEGDDRDFRVLCLLQQRDGRPGVECSEADRTRLLGECSRQHVDLLVDHGLGLRTLEGDLDVAFLGRLLGAKLHRLPELVLEALGDQRDVDVVGARGRGGAQCDHGAKSRAKSRAK